MAFVKFSCLKTFGQWLGHDFFIPLINYLDRCERMARVAIL